MKKFILLTVLILATSTVAMAQRKIAKIKFDKLEHNFGTFTEADGDQKCTFTFTNTGDAPLIINQVPTQCGCTVADYTKKPIQPGEKGEIKVSYSSKRQFPGHISKHVTVYSNAETEMVRLRITGDFVEDKK